jgi:hypothetical protein
VGITQELAAAGPPARPHRGVRAAWLVAGAAVTVLVIGTTGFAFWHSPIARTTATYSAYQTQTYTGQPSAVMVRLASGDVTLRRGPSGRITVRRQLQWPDGKPVISQRWDGHTLRLTQACPTGSSNGNCNVEYILIVPSSVSVTASTGSGNVTVNGVTGRLDLFSASGDLAASGTSGPVSARTSSGNVTVNGATGRLDLFSASGDLAASGTSGPVSAWTSSGNVTVTGARSSDVTAETSSGDVLLAFSGVPARADGESASGNVMVFVPPPARYNVQAGTSAGNRTVTVAQDPASPRVIIANSASGDVTVSYGS